MKLFLPSNIFSEILAAVLKKNDDLEINFKESSLITKELEKDTMAIGLIPSLDIINHKNLFISGKAGISFDGTLANSYFYLTKNEQRTLGTVAIRGDVSLNEIIFTKILFEERFSSEVEIALDTHKEPVKDQNTLVVGTENFKLWDYNNSISFADLMADLLDFPYVNFIFASQDQDQLSKLETIIENIDSNIEENISSYLKDLNYPDDVKLLVQENLGSVYFEMTPNETEALNELIKLVYYHGVIEEIFDIKFNSVDKY
ncbi:MAG: hypothetical protein RDU14_00335 [Melioribacteraceae bacterium]|nr:hypothetical protein [Melioribacteraceae bacterium]